MTVFWGILFLILVVIELATMGLTTIWFAAGALIAVFISAVGLPLWVQILLFTVVSLVLLYFTRPVAIKYFNKDRQKTNAESLIGQTGIVTEAIQNLQEHGSVLLGGMQWSARAEDGRQEIAKDTTVEVLRIEGVKLIVRPVGTIEKAPENYQPPRDR